MGSSGQLYSLSWGEFSSSLASAVQVLRGDGDLVDVTLAAGGRSFRAHKIVLCAASPFLLDLLKSTPCQHPVVMLAGIGADDLESLLEFVYQGEVRVEPAQLPSLLQAAHCLCIHGLTKPTVLTESGEEVPASAIPTATNDGVSRATGNSYYPLKRRKKRRKSSTSSAKWQCTSNTTDSESRPLDDNNRTMPYENKDDDTMETDDTATFVITFGKLEYLHPELINPDAAEIINCVKAFNSKHLKNHPLLWNAYDTGDLDIINAILLIQKYVASTRKDQDGILHGLNEHSANLTACELLLNTKMTSNAAAALLYHIANNKEKQEKLRNEAMSVLKEKTTFITNNTLKDVKYVKACIKESMRLSPIVNGNLRTIEQDSSIGKYKILKGSTVMACHGWLSLHPEYFPEPEKYKPERWLKNEPEYKQSQSYVYQPFGISERSCIGQKIVEMQLTMLILKVVRNFWIEWHYGPLKWKTENTVNTVTSPLRLKIMRIYGK